MCDLEDFSHLKLLPACGRTLTNELTLWHDRYLPIGENVLDVGAGCGETAQFYLNHGAKRVICIEADPLALSCLRENFSRDDRIQIIDCRVDSIKVDIEGAERGMVFETHFPFRLDRTSMPTRYVVLNRVEEDWGSPLRKALRLAGEVFGRKDSKTIDSG